MQRTCPLCYSYQPAFKVALQPAQQDPSWHANKSQRQQLARLVWPSQATLAPLDAKQQGPVTQGSMPFAAPGHVAQLTGQGL